MSGVCMGMEENILKKLCVRERKREREREGDRDRERHTHTQRGGERSGTKVGEIERLCERER